MPKLLKTTSSSKKLRGNRSFEEALIKKIDLENALLELKRIDTLIIMWRFLDDERLEKVASRLNMTVTAVSNREQRALQKLKEKLV